jgi:hypothetical protein
LVDVSPSIEILLNDLLTAFVRSLGSKDGAIGASVAIMPSSVAMFGWIIPAPFVIPAMLYLTDGEDGSENVRDINFGKVSVVQIARAVANQ